MARGVVAVVGYWVVVAAMAVVAAGLAEPPRGPGEVCRSAHPVGSTGFVLWRIWVARNGLVFDGHRDSL